jgi:hypothetical protein
MGFLNAPRKHPVFREATVDQQLLSAVVFPTVAAPTGVMGGGGTVSGDAGFCGREVVACPATDWNQPRAGTHKQDSQGNGNVIQAPA